jgi:hypothetical protein
MPDVEAHIRTNTGQMAVTGAVSLPDPELRQLCELAVDGLVPMFDADQNLFCYRRKLAGRDLIREGVSHRYSMIALLGLLKCEAAAIASPINIRNVLNRLIENDDWIDNIGDLGLLLWLCALASPEHLGKVCSKFDLRQALERFPQAREGRTTELAWFLAGIAHAVLASPQHFNALSGPALQTYNLLKGNHGRFGIFGHLAGARTLTGRLRGHIGCFADQVYPIYALVRFAAAFGDGTALEMARSCAEAICRLQGPEGQWWWHYDSLCGRVFERYPVFSVHQDGMAPMALLALAEATRCDFSEPIYKGLRWITGVNELSRDLRDRSSNIIWRSIYPESKYKRYLTGALTFIGHHNATEHVENPTIKLECRPYHFGWLLYAFADQWQSGPGARVSPRCKTEPSRI